ncbi:P-loop containing nucleoside triphosphate hydrolase protein [Delphinella strobiligena]|nr:P-loop containing nucleoside triphosphate hydrolase protein [Delphinella strobiligena]
MKSARRRDKLIQEDSCIGFEMEGAGTWEVFGTVVVKGVVDYADSHKNKEWRLYPAARAALCAKALIREIELPDVPTEPRTAGAETPPPPASTVPFRRDADFVHRPELDRLRKKLSCPSARLALFGIGGVGKSQIVIEYCYRLRERSPDTWVLWVHASSAARFEEGIRDMADQGTWLLVLDNADEANYLFQPPGEGRTTKRHVDYLPACEHGSIVMTTRNRDMASRFVADDDVITVSPMRAELALALLERKSERQSDTASARQLVDALEGMPLAIAQAAAYIKQRGPRSSVQQYLEEFERSEKSQTSLLDVNMRELGRDREAENSIIMTWQISFEHIRQSRQSAADLLSLMSFFDHQSIPESVLRARDITRLSTGRETKQTRSNDDDSTDSSSEPPADKDFEEDIITLCNYSFISDTLDGTTFEMHRLVQLATRKWLKLRKQHIYWLEQSLWNLNAALPNSNYENWVECRALYPHVKLAFDLKPKSQDACLQWASISNKAAVFVLHQGLARDAERFAKGSTKLRGELLGKEHPDTLISIANLASTYWKQGQWKEAEELFVSVIETRKRVLGEEHPDTLTGMANLAATYEEQGRLVTATIILRKTIHLALRAHGPDYQDIFSWESALDKLEDHSSESRNS